MTAAVGLAVVVATAGGAVVGSGTLVGALGSAIEPVHGKMPSDAVGSKNTSADAFLLLPDATSTPPIMSPSTTMAMMMNSGPRFRPPPLPEAGGGMYCGGGAAGGGPDATGGGPGGGGGPAGPGGGPSGPGGGPDGPVSLISPPPELVQVMVPQVPGACNRFPPSVIRAAAFATAPWSTPAAGRTGTA